MHFVKSVLGLGIVALPHAIQQVGLFVGTIGLTLVGLFTLACMHMLVECAQALSAKAENSYLSYPDVAELSFKFSGSEKIKSWSIFVR